MRAIAKADFLPWFICLLNRRNVNLVMSKKIWRVLTRFSAWKKPELTQTLLRNTNVLFHLKRLLQFPKTSVTVLRLALVALEYISETVFVSFETKLAEPMSGIDLTCNKILKDLTKHQDEQFENERQTCFHIHICKTSQSRERKIHLRLISKLKSIK